jgi:hypothetical protein
MDVKKKRISVNILSHERIINALMDLDPLIFADLFTETYTVATLKRDYAELFRIEDVTDRNYVEFNSVLISTVTKKEKGFKSILEILIKRNTTYLESKGYLEMSAEALGKEFQIGTVPSMHETGISPEMLLLYHFSKNLFEGEVIDWLKASYTECAKESEGFRDDGLQIRLCEGLKGSQIELELSGYAGENGIRNLTEDKFREIEGNFDCNYDPVRKVFNKVKRGILLFFHEKLSDMIENDNHARMVTNAILKKAGMIDRFAHRQRGLIEDRLRQREIIDALTRKNRQLQREIVEFEKRAETQPTDSGTGDKEAAARLDRENYYLKTRIEALEERIAILEDEERINKTIEDDVKIEEIETPTVGLDVSEYYSIVVSGGKWNSRTREKVEEMFPENKIEFIQSNQTLRHRDKILSADLVVFDTTRHSHEYYDEIKRKSIKLMHINKSSPEAIAGLFTHRAD